MIMHGAASRMKRILALVIAASAIGPAMSFAAEAEGDRVSVRVRSELDRYVRRRATRTVNRIEIPLLDVFDLRGIAGTDVDVVFQSRRQGAWVGRVPVTVIVSNSAGELKRGVVTVTLRALAYVPVANRSLSRGSVVKAKDIENQQRDLSELGADVILDVERIVGQRLRRGISAGHVWQERYLESVPLVKRGDPVRLTLSRGGLRIDGIGRAGQDGWAGDWIRVKNDAFRSHVMGEVDREGVVHVRF